MNRSLAPSRTPRRLPLTQILRWLPVLAMAMMVQMGWGQSPQTFNTSGTWTCPANVFSVQVEAWGGGGSGGASINGGGSPNRSGAGGGGGGAYASKTVSVTPGTSYSIVVGAGGAAGSTSNPGSDSTFATSEVVAKGGLAGSSVNGSGLAGAAGAGGSASTSVGDVKYSGGSGAAGTTTSTAYGGGGGSSSGTGTNGNNGSTSTGGSAPTGGGAGGAGRTSSAGNGSNGSIPGGGGGGALSASNTGRLGGAGGAGRVILTYSASSAPTVTTPTSTSITTTTASLGGNITATGGSNVTERGIFYSTTNGFADGAGSKVGTTTGAPFSAGTFTQDVTGLSAGTTYYFKAFATNTTGMAYSAQGTFSTTGATPPTLTAAAGATVDAPFSVTFTDDATWRGAITGVTVGGTTLTAGFTVSAGSITFTPSASVPANLLQASGTKTISVQATGYSSATVSQSIGAGAATQLAITTQPTAPAANPGALAAQPVVVIRDQYANLTASTATVTAAVGAGTWTLGGTAGVAATTGTATFSGLTATSAAAVTGATITFTSPGLTSVTSSTFNIPAPVTGSLVTTYIENFDSIGTDGTALPTGWSHIGVLGGSNSTWGATIPASGTTSAATAGTVNNTLIVNSDAAAATASSNTQAYNFALSGSTSDRSIGTSPTSDAGNILQLRLVNNTGAAVSSLTLSYDIRRFVAGPGGADSAPGYVLFYSTNSGSTWTEVTALTPTSTTVPNTVGVSNFGPTAITLAASVANGAEIRFRWVDDNAQASSPDQLIGLDNISISPATAPTVVTGTSGSITQSGSVISGNDVTSDGGAAVTERGVVYATTANPTTADPKVAVAGTTGNFNATLTGLTENTTYNVRAFATNGVGTSYGSQISFTTAMPSGTITTGGTVTARSTTYGTASTAASFTVSGTGLTGNLTVTPPAGFETSLTDGSGYGATTTITASGTLASTTVYVRLAAATAPGTYSGNIVVSGGDASSQNVAIPASTVDVKPLTLTGAAVTSKSYDGTDAATITGTLSGINGSDVVGFTGTGTFASVNIGTNISVTAALVLTGADAAKYSITQPADLTGNITLGANTITFPVLAAKSTGDAPFALTATASSGLAVTYTSSNTAVATVSGSTVTIIAAGTTTITASQAGNSNYAAATPVDQTLDVTTGPTVLTPGDIAVLALQTDDADQFAFVTLVNLNPNTQVSFTDNAWTGTALNSNENTIVWQVPAGGLTAGSVVTFTNGTGFSTGTTVSGTYSGASTSGDQVIVYQGTPASPTLIYAFSNLAWIATGSPNNNNSYLPSSLTNGTSARDFTTEVDNAYYGHPATFGADKAAFLAAIGNIDNWQRDADRVTLLPSWSFFTPASNLVVTTRLAKLANWKYLDTSVDPGTTWRNAGFDDTTWSSGAAPLGAGDAHIATTVNIGAVNRHTVYFRKTFTIPNASAVQHLRLNILRDDGVVVYLNGTEVARDNMAAGTVAHNQTAPNNTESTAESTYWTSNALPLSALVDGTNTIAVQVHNRSLSSSDLGFDIEVVEYATPTIPVIATGTAGSITRTTASISSNSVSSDGNSAITERGVVFATSANPTIVDTKVIVSGTTGSFDAALTGLTGGTTYHVRAYATNAVGTAYGSGISFTTNAAPVFSGMTVSTQAATALLVIESKILARITDADGDTVIITGAAANSAQGGTVSRTGGIITYTPATAFSGSDSFTVSVDDGFGAVNITIQVTVATDPLFTSSTNAPRITDLGGGAKRIAFNGIPGRTYAVQRSTTLDPGSWEQIAAVTSASDSTVTYEDPNPPQPSAFYRIAYPAQ